MHKSSLVLLIVTSLTMGACAQAPTADIEAATAALDQAAAAGAADYAAEALKAAQDAKAQLEAELKAQDGSFMLMRSYTEATKLATTAKEAAALASKAAAEGKEKAKGEAAQAVTDAQATLQAATGLLEKAPRGKGTAQDIEAMKTDLAGAATALADAEAAIKTEKFKDALAKAAAARTAADTVKSAVEQAMAARGGRR